MRPISPLLAALLLGLTACSDDARDAAPYDLSDPQANPQPEPEPEPDPDPDPAPLRPLSITQLAAGAAHTCAVEGGALYCWGAGYAAQPQRVAGMESQVSAVAAGRQHTCAIKAGDLYCWGDNTMGQLGAGSTDPAVLMPTRVEGMEGVSLVAAGASHTCAVKGDELYCWGDNVTGQLGDPARSSDRADKPGLVPGVRAVTSLGAGAGYTCAATEPDTSCLGGQPCVPVYCWGDNRSGQANAEGARQILRAPQVVSRHSSARVYAGRAHLCWDVSSALHCRGENARGQTGDDPASAATSFGVSSVRGFERATRTAAGGDAHTCASQVGMVSCWGANDKGQLGVAGGDRYEPVRVTPSEASFDLIAAGASHTCAAGEGELWCWGANDAGQLGATTSPTSPPVRVALP